jgi:RimJ/RimL family protein N-acetyltransferase
MLQNLLAAQGALGHENGPRYAQLVAKFSAMSFCLTTERLSMSPWADSDVKDLRALVSERGDGTPSLENIRNRITTQRAETLVTGIALLPIRRKIEGDFIGYCGLIVGRTSVDEPEIAYELFKRVHGYGYATEAATAVLEAGFATGRQRIWATVGAWNTPSLRVLDKLGFRRDHSKVLEDRGEVVWMVRDP